jgi:hypothetical protein
MQQKRCHRIPHCWRLPMQRPNIFGHLLFCAQDQPGTMTIVGKRFHGFMENRFMLCEYWVSQNAAAAGSGGIPFSNLPTAVWPSHSCRRGLDRDVLRDAPHPLDDPVGWQDIPPSTGPRGGVIV